MEKVNINLVPSGVMPSCHASQNDKTRTVRFYLKNEGSDITLAGTEVIKCKVTKPNGASATIDVTNTSSNYVDVDFTDAELDVSGSALCELSVDGIGSLNFVLRIEEDAYNGANIEIRTASGEIATFTTDISDNLVTCVVDINAIQSGSGTPDNPSPITGFNGATIVRCGVNLWDEVIKAGYTISGAGVETPTANAWCSQNYIPLLPNTTYYLKSPMFLNVRWYDINKNYLGYGILNANSTFNSNSAYPNARYLRFNYGGTTYNNDISINYPSTDTAYHKYIGSKYAYYFEGLLNGTYERVDLGSLSWGKSTNTNNTYFYALYNSGANGAYNSPATNIICSDYVAKSRNAITNTSGEVGIVVENNAIYIADGQYDNYTTTEFANAMKDVCLLVPLVTPITPTFSQSELDIIISKFSADLVCVAFGQTVYGGVLDVTNGKLTITHGLVTYSDSTGFVVHSNSERFYHSGNPTGLDYSRRTESISNQAIYQDIYGSYGAYFAFGSSGIYINKLTSAETLTDLDTRLQNTPMTICYPLATPIEITLTPKQIETLLGTNNIFSDTGEIEVSYLCKV